jgi:rhodanese-related sulfurtransferase
LNISICISAVNTSGQHFLLVGSRNPEEYREAHIPGALNIPQKRMDDFWGLVPVQGSWIRRKRLGSAAIQAAVVKVPIKSS